MRRFERALPRICGNGPIAATRANFPQICGRLPLLAGASMAILLKTLLTPFRYFTVVVAK
jgi:hypothetical protein